MDNIYTYVILLRAVNVSGKNIIKMADLREQLKDAGYKNVQTYIQSGNIILESDLSKAEIENRIQSLIQLKFQLDIPVFALRPLEIENIITEGPQNENLDPSRLFITVLNQAPETALTEALRSIDHGDEWFNVKKNILYFYIPQGMAKSKMNNAYFERKLKVVSTGRNLNTFQKLLALSKK
ncbi:DUF1697 domain-containing protein [Sphingobacterium sp. LRF_L2]|uniref:DUF1697 domain-containing protein n=1 Tax=Sphingobacterium sp. LRF_L2 TaxID=3369421 RepID=UPI003F5FA13F